MWTGVGETELEVGNTLVPMQGVKASQPIRMMKEIQQLEMYLHIFVLFQIMLIILNLDNMKLFIRF